MKSQEAKMRLAALGGNAQKMLGNVSGTVTGTVTSLVQNVRHKSDAPLEDHEMLLKNEMEFHQAAKNNDVDTMERLKGQKVNINARNVLDRTALHFAVAGCNYQAVSFLIGHKARVDIADKHGLTLLHLAAWSADLSVVQMLVKAGASQKATNQDGMNVLHFAAQNDKNEIVDYLLKDLQLKDLNIKDGRGREPFHLAAEKGHINMIKNLLDMGLFTSEMDKDGNTALHLAAANGHKPVVSVLLEKWGDQEKDGINKDGATPFYLAVDGGHEACAELLLQDGCDINTTNHEEYTALQIAAEKGHLSLVNFLIRNNIDLTPKPNGDSVQPKNSSGDHFQKTEPTSASLDKNPPIHLAIEHDHMDIVDALFDAGYDINALNKRQQTPLHLAAELKNTDLVEKLLRAGCDLTIVDKQGKTPLGAAARSGHTLIVDMIIKAERYYAWKKELTENHAPNTGENTTEIEDRTSAIENGDSELEDVSQEEPVTFKQDHSPKTSQMRSALWSLAYQQLKPGEWKKLAQLWKFTEPQIKSIETQWTDKASYKEHGHRMLLIWLHGILLKRENPIKSLYEDLVQTGHQNLAETFRVQSMNGVQTKKCIIS